jgi:hypothetical protein
MATPTQSTLGSPAKVEGSATQAVQGRASLVLGRCAADFDVSLTWEVDMILSELPDSANALPINHPLPLQGKWTLRITSKLDSVRLSIVHGEPDNRFLGGVDATLELRWESPDAGVGDAPVLLARQIWSANEEGSACTELGPGFVHKFPRNQIERAGKLASEDFDYGAVGSFHVVLRLRRRQKALHKVDASEQAEQIAKRFAGELPLLGTASQPFQD